MALQRQDGRRSLPVSPYRSSLSSRPEGPFGGFLSVRICCVIQGPGQSGGRKGSQSVLHHPRTAVGRAISVEGPYASVKNNCATMVGCDQVTFDTFDMDNCGGTGCLSSSAWRSLAVFQLAQEGSLLSHFRRVAQIWEVYKAGHSSFCRYLGIVLLESLRILCSSLTKEFDPLGH